MSRAARLRAAFGSIRGKLMCFTALLCVVIIALLWVLNVQLLEPMYYSQIRRSLTATAQAYTSLITQYGVIEDDAETNGISAAFFEAVNSVPNADTLLADKCLDIADANGFNLLHSEQSGGNCALHPMTQAGPFGDKFGDKRERDWNSLYTVALRRSVLQNGDTVFLLDFMDKTQMVLCRNVDNQYTVIVSTDLERIGESGHVIGRMMPLVACIVLVLGLAGAFFFSRWFARPLTEISHAARAVTAGNYDVSVPKRSNDEIGVLAQDFNTMTREVARTAQLQRDLIANISHDLRTPLTLIKGYAETVRDISGDDKDKRDAQLGVIIDETDRLSGLVNSVMELSKVSSGAEKPNLVTFDLAQLCEEIAYRYLNVCEQNGWTFEIDTDTPCEVTADPDMLSRALHNLLGNALHHIGDGKWMALRCIPLENGNTRVEISDHGEGISADDLPYIFDRYYRTRASTGKTGTGLGLSITKAVFQSHGFPFGVDSTPGKGSTFWFIASKAAPGDNQT